MNGIELFERIKQVSTFSELVHNVVGKTNADTQSKKGNIFEKVWDIIIKFGFCSILPNDIYDHYEGNINTCELQNVHNLEIYLRHLSIYSRGKGGSSDITLQNKNTGKWAFISSKFYLDDYKKSVDDYDVEKIIAVTNVHKYEYKEYDIYLLVNDKQKVLGKISSSQTTNNYITNNIHHILDLSDLEIGFQKLKLAIQNVSFDEVNSRFCNKKVPLELRFHQELITHKMMIQIDNGEKELLLGAKARSGKTYCVGGLFIKYQNKYDSLNCLIITPAPTETITQFTDGLFHKFREFTGINIIEIKNGTDFETMFLDEKNIIIVSKQLLDDYLFEKKVLAIQHLNLDFIVFDENHFHGTTEKSKNILESYSSSKTINLYLTATYAKPLNEWNIQLDSQFYWDIEDEQLCKKRDIQGLLEKHGKYVSLFLTEENKEQILRIYDNMPDLHIITNMMDSERYEEIKYRIKDTSYGFSNGTLLSGNFPNEVDMILRYTTGSNKEQDYPERDMSIFGRIKKISISNNSRTMLNNKDFTTQLWFLSYGFGMPIEKVSEHLKDRMLKNSVLKNYEIKIVNSKKNYHVKNIKIKIENWESKAKEDGKYGLILLAGNQLTLGITLPFVDIVFLFNDTISSDKIIQMMYRCMTERIRNPKNDEINSGEKKIGFVVDFNISRVLNTMVDYTIHKKDLNMEQKFTYLVDNNLINIDSDLFQGKENKTKLVEKLLHIWKDNPLNNLKLLLKKIETNVIDMDTTDQKMCNQYFTGSVGNKKNKKNDENVKFDEESIQELPTGKKIIKENSNSETDEETEPPNEEDKTKDINVSLSKDILPFIVPLICILTISTVHKDILEMLNIIKGNPIYLEVFEDQTYIWWKREKIIELVKQIVDKYVKKDSPIYNIAIQFKMSLQNLIDKPKELLEFIDSCLEPKQREKEDYGEAFTPMKYVFELLDKLDRHYTKTVGRSIFSEPNLKWFDPAAGMGNFPVAVYLKLMDGLTQHIPNDEERKKHIIENMLFMSEINKKNVFVCHQIFNINNKYKLNIYQGDTLTLDILNVWGIQNNGFDIILTNIPFNNGGIRSHTGKKQGDKNETVWPKFINKSFEWLKPDGFLVFINPLSWLKNSHSLHNKMLEKHIVWLKLWDNIKSLASINGKIPVSLYILQNTINTSNEKTEIISEILSKKVTTSSNVYLNPNISIPIAFHNVFNKLTEFIETRNLQIEYKTKTIKSSGTKVKIPTQHTLEDFWAVDTFTIKDGLMVKKATEKHPDAGKRKLIIANKSSFAGAFIDEGKLGLTGSDKSYILGENLELILKMLSFKISSIISHYTKYRQDFLENEIYRYLPDIRKLGISDITEDEFYKLIGLTEQEINQIRNPASKEIIYANEKIKIKKPLYSV